MDDIEYEEFKQYLLNKIIPIRCVSNKCRNEFLEKAKKYCLKSNLLALNASEDVVFIAKKSEYFNIVMNHHITFDHQNASALQRRLNWFWKGMSADIKRVLENCSFCKDRKKKKDENLIVKKQVKSIEQNKEKKAPEPMEVEEKVPEPMAAEEKVPEPMDAEEKNVKHQNAEDPIKEETKKSPGTTFKPGIFKSPTKELLEEVHKKLNIRRILWDSIPNFQKDGIDMDNHVPKRLIKIDGDGNCCFRALSYCITGSERNHPIFRRALIEYKDGRDPSFEIDDIKEEKGYGSTVDLYRFGEMFQCRVFVWIDIKGEKPQYGRFFDEDTVKFDIVIHYKNEHFSVVDL